MNPPPLSLRCTSSRPRGRVAGPGVRRHRTGSDAGRVALGLQEPAGGRLHADVRRRLVRPLHRGADARRGDRRHRAGQSGRPDRPLAGDGRQHPVLFGVRHAGGLGPDAGRDARAAISRGPGGRRHVAQRHGPGLRMLVERLAAAGLRRDERRPERGNPAALADRPHLADHARLVAVALLPGRCAGTSGACRVLPVTRVADVAGLATRRQTARRRRSANCFRPICGERRCWRS